MAAGKALPQEQGAPAPYESLITRIVQVSHLPAQCRIRWAEYPAFREALRARLQSRGLREGHIEAVLRGRLVGTCPACGVRLSLEYLEALCAAGDPGPDAGAAARFAEGRCVNAACPSTDIRLSWRP